MGKPSDIFVVPSFELITPDDLHPAVLPAGRPENHEQPGGMVVALARALVERALDRFLDVPAPNQELIIGQVQIDVTEQHRGSRPGLEAQGRHAVLDGEGRLHWPTRPERAVIPTRREWIEREERRREIHHCHFRLTITGDHVGPLAPAIAGGHERQNNNDLLQTRCGRGHLFFHAVLTAGPSPPGSQSPRPPASPVPPYATPPRQCSYHDPPARPRPSARPGAPP